MQLYLVGGAVRDRQLGREAKDKDYLAVGWTETDLLARYPAGVRIGKAFPVVLVPGLAFSTGGCRLGRGQGFYDRLLAGASGLRCGVGWDFQVFPELPSEPHDEHLDYILTPTRWVVCPSRTAVK